MWEGNEKKRGRERKKVDSKRQILKDEGRWRRKEGKAKKESRKG